MRRRRWENSVAGFAIAVKPSPRCFEFLKVWEYLCRDPDVFYHADHRRMTWALNITQPRKRNIAAALEKAVTVNAGKDKERSIAFYRFLPVN
jgi:hypothetical protein